jgi:RHS repeat-associated protein
MNDDQDAEVVQSNSYSAFGLLALGPDGTASKFNNRFYNGKEKQEGTGWLDYGARMYSPEMGRWMSIDPKTDTQESWTPFHYGYNNPIRFTDPDGREPCCGGVGDFLMGFTHAFNENVSPLPGTSLVNQEGGRNYSNGVKFGHRAALIVGVIETGGGGAGVLGSGIVEVVSGGLASPAAVPVGLASGGAVIHGIATVRSAWKNLNSEGGKYSELKEPRKVGDGLETTPSQRKRILEENKKQNDGTLKSDGDGRTLNPPKRTLKGEKADMNQAEVDHIIPRSKGGSNSNSNQRVLSKEENGKKGNREQ